MYSRSLRLLLLVTLLAWGVGVRPAQAQVPGPFRGCVNLNNGLLRVLAGSMVCGAWEYPITWNEEGAPGPAGPAGGLEIRSDLQPALGRVISWAVDTPRSVVTLLRQGYVVKVFLNGEFQTPAPGTLWWTGPNCTGDAYLLDAAALQARRPGGTLVDAPVLTASGVAHTLFTIDAPSVQTTGPVYIEQKGSRLCVLVSTHTAPAWRLVPLPPDTLGWTFTTEPFGIGPLQIVE